MSRRRKRARPVLRQEIPPSELAADPLARERLTSGQMALVLAGLVVGAIVIHVLFTVAIGGASKLFAVAIPEPEEEVEVTILEPPPPEEKEEEVAREEEEEAEEEAEEEEVEVEEEEQVETRTETTEEPEEQQEEETRPPQTGINFESTVEGGEGGAFGVGESRRGKTDEEAADPTKKVRREPENKDEKPVEPVKKNRRSQNIPTEKAALVKPKRTRRVQPAYPPTLKAQGIEANVVVQVDIDESGKVVKVDILAPAEEEPFNQAARAAALKEVFSPATRGGTPIPYTLTYTYRFRINE